MTFHTNILSIGIVSIALLLSGCFHAQPSTETSGPGTPTAECRPSGCSGEVCSDEDVVSNCIYKEEFACYKNARCERQANGRCGWTETDELTACLTSKQTQGGETVDAKSNLIRVTNLEPNALVKSPLTVSGEARGYWYFEASFPIRLEDANGTVLVQSYAMAKGEWMTTEFVPFTTQLTFKKPTTKTGFLVLEKDNPSGLPEQADELKFPVRFE
ncbi:MAG TPA: Gmad2 immunoglobulin-like domain-containing protein [Candidatus Kapabacteria bacterium]|nr:Gmad2 immunoglobulin-like domain-containing protein [Candidatus Kapabacteria bacterium]